MELSYFHLLEDQIGTEIKILGILHWKSSNLVQNLELRHVILLAANMGSLLENLKYIHL